MTDFNKFKDILTANELAAYTLRALYCEYGYMQYKMSKFEEYELYIRNKDFLISDNIITFTDTDGRLLALKPDVTLSIIKNSSDMEGGIMKACYNENVYRVSGGTKSFKEIMQVGLECIGDIKDDMLFEVISLAKKSLNLISGENVLEISQLDIVSGVLDFLGLVSGQREEYLSLLAGKNVNGIESLCNELEITGEGRELLVGLSTISGSVSDTVGKLDLFAVNEQTRAAIAQLRALSDALRGQGLSEGVNIDFSVVNDMNYYNGLCFTGFVEGIPTGILSGGQYDKLMTKMMRRDRAIGFAVYLDELDNLPR